ncbi:deoxynucleoside kinase [Sporosarcina sp. Te-1]|uniref:deoxynucleoside kinase n=1 Tax=Sporosarcina sp. Te-1 TaxID=2818390 RepID=UPI001A9FC15E|nr:deoxynucleoside kinase [Sporosarcina sp. Te-1]QTD40195.1 deoxynucleoside kinase [Sporosarcina sp. Te-1]
MNLRETYGIPKNAVITIAGTVGVGKSTMTHALAQALGFRTSLENVDENPYLDRFYDDFEKWSFHLQIYFLAERFKEQKRIFEYGGGFIQDRSIYEDTGIFATMHKDQGTMDPVDFDTYTKLFEAMVMTPYFPHPDLLIYLDGPFETILSRIQERGRDMEQHTPVSYWEGLYNRYAKWIDSFNSCPVLRIDITDYDLVERPEEVEAIVERIGNMMNLSSLLKK